MTYSLPEPKTKAAAAFERIRNAIQEGDIAPGTRITLTELAAELGMSLTPVREALRLLASQGLVVYTPHYGSVVAEHKWSDAEQIYDLRLLLEPHAVKHAGKFFSESDEGALVAIQNEADAVIASGDIHLLPDINRRFHSRLYETARFPQLSSFIDTLWSGMPFQTMSLTDRAKQSSAEHHEILEKLIDGDISGASIAMRAHISDAAERAREVLSHE